MPRPALRAAPRRRIVGVHPPATPLPNLDPSATYVTPKRAQDFVNSVNTNIHTMYFGTPYADDAATNAKLVELGIKGVRDQYPLTNDSAYDTYWGRSANRYNTYGIRTAFIMDPTQSGDSVIRPNTAIYGHNKIVAFGLIPATIAILSPNEWDRDMTNLFPNLTAEQQRIWNAFRLQSDTASIPIIGGNMAGWSDTSKASTLGSQGFGNYCDAVEIHNYQGDTLFNDAKHNTANAVANAIKSGGPKWWTTESGFGTYSTGIITGNWPVSLQAQAIRGLQGFFYQFSRGVPHTFWYELFDQHTDGGYESNLGMCFNNGTNKPLGNSVKYTLGFLSDPGTPVAVSPNEFGFILTNTDVNTKYDVYKFTNGTYALVLWQHEESQNGSNTTLLTPTPRTVTIKPPAGVTFDMVGIRPNDMTSSTDIEYPLVSGVTNSVGRSVSASYKPLVFKITKH